MDRIGVSRKQFETRKEKKKRSQAGKRIESAIIFVDNERLLWALNFLYIAL